MHGSTSLIGASLAENITRIYPIPGIGLMQDVDELLRPGGKEVVEEASVKWLNVHYKSKKHLSVHGKKKHKWWRKGINIWDIF